MKKLAFSSMMPTGVAVGAPAHAEPVGAVGIKVPKTISQTQTVQTASDIGGGQVAEINRRALLLGMVSMPVIATLNSSVTSAHAANPSEARYWRGSVDIQSHQGFITTVTQQLNGKTNVHVHFSNGRRDGGGLFVANVDLLDVENMLIAQSSQFAALRARSLWGGTRTADQVVELELAPADAARIARIRMIGYRYPMGTPMMTYIKFGNNLEPKWPPYFKKPPGLPPYAPNVSYNGVTPSIDLSPWTPPQPVSLEPVLRPGLDKPFIDSHGNVRGYF